MTTARMRLVGEGDDQILSWNSPVGDYHNVISICDRCREFGFSFPILELQGELKDHGVPLKLTGVNTPDEAAALVEALLSPYFHISNSAWGGESPGRSGVFQRAYLELGHTKHLRKILQIADDFISSWSEDSGLDAAIKAAQAKREFDKREKEETKVLAASDFQQDQRFQEEAWEDQLFNQVLAACLEKRVKAFCRFNFLVHNGVIFYLDRAWWHSTKGSVSNVAERLERTESVNLVRCEVRKTRFGWIPHFGRTREEELFVGWRETGISVTSSPGWAEQLSNAMCAEK